jgi:hypothetical protein
MTARWTTAAGGVVGGEDMEEWRFDCSSLLPNAAPACPESRFEIEAIETRGATGGHDKLSWQEKGASTGSR